MDVMWTVHWQVRHHCLCHEHDNDSRKHRKATHLHRLQGNFSTQFFKILKMGKVEKLKYTNNFKERGGTSW